MPPRWKIGQSRTGSAIWFDAHHAESNDTTTQLSDADDDDDGSTGAAGLGQIVAREWHKRSMTVLETNVQVGKICSPTWAFGMERVTGIKPASRAWESAYRAR
jgi:hypothetical protein